MKEILIYGPIGGSTDPRDVVRQFQESKGEEILLRIHSEGGSVLDGEAILNAIRQHDAEVSAQVDGMAFSMAGVIALEVGPDRLTMPEDGWLMFHEVRNYSGGTEEDLERQLGQMRTMNESISGKISKALGISNEEAAQRLKDEIWLNGKEALEVGLVSSLLPAQALAAHVDVFQWQNVPRNFFDKLLPPREPEPVENQTSGLKMKFFKLFNNKQNDGEPILEVAEIGPEDLGPELAAMKKELDETVATNAAALVVRDERHAQAMQNALDEQRKELEANHAKEIEAKNVEIELVGNSADEKANATLAQAGHEPLEVLSEDSATAEEKVKAEYAAFDISNYGEAAKRKAFRAKHSTILGG